MKPSSALLSLCVIASVATTQLSVADTDVYAPFPAPTTSCTVSSSNYCGTNGCYIQDYAVPGCQAIINIDPKITTCDASFIAQSNCLYSVDYQCNIEQQDCTKLKNSGNYPDLDCATVYQTCTEQLGNYKNSCC